MIIFLYGYYYNKLIFPNIICVLFCEFIYIFLKLSCLSVHMFCLLSCFYLGLKLEEAKICEYGGIYEVL